MGIGPALDSMICFIAKTCMLVELDSNNYYVHTVATFLGKKP